MAMRYPGGLIAPTPVNANYPSGVWTPSQSLPYQQQNVWTRDQYWPYTTLLLQGNGTNGAQNNTFLDSSSNNFSITRNGNTTQGSFTPYEANGYWSNYFDGTGDYLSFTKQTTTGSFTCECWFYRGEDVSGYHIIFSGNNLGSVNPDNAQLRVSNAGAVELALAGSGVIPASGTSVIKNQWNHIAWVRSGTSCAIFVNGTRIATGTSSSALNVVSVGTYLSGYEPNGYVSNARINTTAVYDPSLTTCTVPTAPLTAITGTYLLTCQSNRFIDNSASPLTITVNGNPSVQAFQPFPGATTWSASVLGGSGYFDGSGDSLQTPSNAAFTFGTGDFTLECWAYLSGNYPGVVSGIVDISTSNSTGRLVLDLYSTGYVNIETVGVSLVASNTLLPKNAWSHLVAVRSGTTLSLFQNGTRVGTATNSTNFSFSQAYVGVTSDGYYWSGYLSSVRLVKGTAVYDPSQSTLTVPTSPLTNISNTSLLLNMTNAGIFDNAQMNDLETVGNAQVSTSVVKYGTGSMAFDGSGDYLVGRTTDLLSFNTGDFTVEMWVYPNSVAGNIVLIDTRSSGTDSGWAFYINSSSKLALFTSNADRITAGSALSASTWTHVVLARSGSTLAIYMNGVQSATATYSTTMTCPGRISIASGFDNAAPLNGYLDDLRITKGVARYISTFTPPPARMPQQ